jgi:hypothetical protein
MAAVADDTVGTDKGIRADADVIAQLGGLIDYR